MEEIPAFSIWKTFYEMIPALMSTKPSEKGAEHFAKIIKSGEVSNIFIFTKDPSHTLEQYQKAADKYKAFTKWFLGGFFYLLSRKKSDKGYNVYVDIQLCVLEQLSNTQVSLYQEISEQYLIALSLVSSFIKSGSERIKLDVFVPEEHADLNLNLKPVLVEIQRDNHEQFLLNLLKIISFIIKHNFDFEFFDPCTEQALDNLLYLLSQSPFQIKFEILKMYLELNTKNDRILAKMQGFAQIFEIIKQNVIDNNLSKEECEIFGALKFETKSSIEQALQNYDISVLCGIKNVITSDIWAQRVQQENLREIRIFNFKTSKWKLLFFNLVEVIDNSDCGTCKMTEFLNFMGTLSDILIDIKIEMRDSPRIVFFDEGCFFIKILSYFNRHFTHCDRSVNINCFYDVCVKLAMIYVNVNVFSDIFMYNFKMVLGETPPNVDPGLYRKEMTQFCQTVSQMVPKDVAFEYLIRYITSLCGFFETPLNIEDFFFNIMKTQSKVIVIQYLPHLLTIFKSDTLISDVLLPALRSHELEILRTTVDILPQIICMTSSTFKKDRHLVIVCDKCDLPTEPNVTFARIETDLPTLHSAILRNVLGFLTFDDRTLKTKALAVLPSCSRHILKFHNENVAKIWIEYSDDVRETFARVIPLVIRNCWYHEVLADTVKTEIIGILFGHLLKLSKKCLINTDIKLQETVLEIIDGVITLQCDVARLPTIKILIYLIMVPTSRHSLVAVNKLVQLSNLNTINLYKHYKREITELITHLCLINQSLLGWNLNQSLGKIAVSFDFYNAKDFISRECQNLLPFFIVKVLKNKQVSQLIEEMALMVNMAVPELITNIYGNIFLHVFLNEPKEDFKFSTNYVESMTGLPAATLRKKNLWVILNELLLNFHQKRDKVLMALNYLSRDDSESKSSNVQEYLQLRLLGLLQHFDFKLMSKSSNGKSSILLSLADFFTFMGPNYIGPVRFKIIAMLRTADCGGYPELTADVWSAFVRSCDVDSLAPQLATIFVSLLPLVKSCPKKSNDIFKYLIVQHEHQTKDFIKDLFFVDDHQKVDPQVVQMIRKYTTPLDNTSFKNKIQHFLKYLTHETSEVRIGSLQKLKFLMEKNREELDQMILGYNGIDPVIVKLIEMLTLGCREKDEELKLACGEVFGELGAVEPSHLPRKYAQNTRTFAFFINDDGFIVNALNELTKALQGEKNTVCILLFQNMDRLAVAIQEILKNYDISPEKNSSRNDLWRQFPETQQSLMLPFLTSRYIVSPPQELTFPVPLYGSNEGCNFEVWLYNWTRSLISTLPQDSQCILHPCLPAMKQDNRILMIFLPYVLLQSIISDLNDNREKAYIEIKTVTNFFEHKSNQTQNSQMSQSNLVGQEKCDHIQTTKVAFILLDFLDRWTREWQWTNGSRGRNDFTFLKIKNFTERFCKLQLAKSNFNCGEYSRSLMYLEDYITRNSQEAPNQLTFLATIYAQLDEPDGVTGVTALQQSEPPIEQRLLSLEVSGKLSDAAACYERLPPPLKIHHVTGLIRCYLDLDNVNTALNFAQGALDRQPEFGNMLLALQAEPLWRLGHYDDLNELLNRPELNENSSWGISIGRALVAFENRDRESFRGLLQGLKRQQVALLGAASVEEGAYQRGYSNITALHCLNELEQVERVTFNILSTNEVRPLVQTLSKEWELRIKVVQESIRIIEPLLCLRRVALEQSKKIIQESAPSAVPLINSLLGELWLASAQIARNAGSHQQSYTYTLKAEEFAPPKLFLEKSQLHWLREEHEQALTCLNRGLEVLQPDSTNLDSLSLEKRKICAEAKLLIACYNDSVSNVDTDIKTSYYREASEVYKEWETGLVKLAQFYDRRFQNYSDDDRDVKGSEMQIWMISYFCKSLRYGTAYVYQSMPRLLSIWFDYGTRLLDVRDTSKREERKNNLMKMTKLIDYALETLPAYVFFTAFSQIISRICHPQKEVNVELKAIIIKLLLHYPQQSLWTIISVMKSSYQARVKRCVEIFNDPKLKTDSMVKLVRDFTALAEKLIELCNKDVPGDVETTSVSNLLRTLPRLLSKADFSEIMVPTHRFRKLVLPNPDFANVAHNPFPNRYVHIVGIDEEMTILRSLQRPRKITLRGSDGKGYIQMLKPKDDLRKDFRLMEFNDIVNQLLSRESESRQRRLNIRLYSVAPLNEECGLIEWIPNLVGLRPILLSIYKQKSVGMTMREIKEASLQVRDTLKKKRDVFVQTLLSKHPPVLGEWFRRTFPDAQSWFFARTAYIRTTAVISMVGYILGLGDRHGENILLDSICGDTVHVDFNCLFNKGESFEWPERVPFRLTQNMVSAMGPLGVEGVFRKSCACTLRVLRTNANTLMSIVTPFVYDPLVSWPRIGAANINTAERTNEQALDHVKNIELRLQGIIVKTRDRSLSIPLSVDGQTNSLINEAMNVDNLCQMYIGWAPYL